MMSWPLAWSSICLGILRFGKCYKSLFSKRTFSKVPIVNSIEMIHMVHSWIANVGIFVPYNEAGEASVIFPPPFAVSTGTEKLNGTEAQTYNSQQSSQFAPNQLNWRFLKPFFSRSGFLCTYCQPEAFEFHHVSKVKVGSKWYWDASSVGHGYFWSTRWTSTISRSSKPLEDGDAFEQAPHECQLFHEGLFICLSYRQGRHGMICDSFSWPARCRHCWNQRCPFNN